MNQTQSVNGKRPVQATRYRDDRTQTAQQDELIRYIYDCKFLHQLISNTLSNLFLSHKAHAILIFFFFHFQLGIRFQER